MNYESAIAALLNHANAPSDRPFDESNSLVFSLYKYKMHKTTPDQVAVALEQCRSHLIDCLEVINKSWNGPVPSETFGAAAAVDSVAAWAVAGIMEECNRSLLSWRFSESVPLALWNAMAFTAWSISCAWCAILDGDIDSLGEHVALEYWALQTPQA